jgi:hypothetical protein
MLPVATHKNVRLIRCQDLHHHDDDNRKCDPYDDIDEIKQKTYPSYMSRQKCNSPERLSLFFSRTMRPNYSLAHRC